MQQLFLNEDNVHLLSVAVEAHMTSQEQHSVNDADAGSCPGEPESALDGQDRVSYAGFLKVLTSEAVVDVIVKALGV